jgi:hypothetical protein
MEVSTHNRVTFGDVIVTVINIVAIVGLAYLIWSAKGGL